MKRGTLHDPLGTKKSNTAPSTVQSSAFLDAPLRDERRLSKNLYCAVAVEFYAEKLLAQPKRSTFTRDRRVYVEVDDFAMLVAPDESKSRFHLKYFGRLRRREQFVFVSEGPMHESKNLEGVSGGDGLGRT